MFLVLSFDFGGSSNVSLHAATEDEAAAEAVYGRLTATGMLVEMLETGVPEFALERGVSLFWDVCRTTNPTERATEETQSLVRVVASNNR